MPYKLYDFYPNCHLANNNNNNNNNDCAILESIMYQWNKFKQFNSFSNSFYVIYNDDLHSYLIVS